MKTEAKAAELRRRLEARSGRRRSGVRGALRDETLAFTRARVAEGATQSQIARELGVTQTSVSRWCREMRRGALVPVEIVQPRAAAAVGVAIVSPRGLRVEGLDLEAVCVVLARLG